MAYASEVMGGGISAGQAQALGGGSNASVTAAGSASTDATLLVSSNNIVASADGTKGVILASGAVGDEVWVFNNAGSTLKVYPQSGGKICLSGTGLGTTDAAHSLLTFKAALYHRTSSTQWLVIVT
jgi:hypothetical protein